MVERRLSGLLANGHPRQPESDDRGIHSLKIDSTSIRIAAFVPLLLVAFAGTGFAADSPDTSEAPGSVAEQEAPATAEGASSVTAETEAPQLRGRVKRWGMIFSGFLVSFDTKMRWETPAPIDPELDLEEDLGLEDEQSRVRFETVLRVSKRSILSLEYIRLRRASVRAVLSKPIIWEDEIFLPGATVESDFDTDIYKFAWTWSAVRKPWFDLGITAGISAIDFSASLRGILTSSGGPGTPEFRSMEEETAVYPVPVLGIRLGGNLRHNLLLRGHAQYFRYTDDKLGAELLDALVALEYIPFNHVGFGVGYDYFEVKYRQDRDNLEIGYLFEGPIVYLRLLY
jgi:hypothetical protein